MSIVNGLNRAGHFDQFGYVLAPARVICRSPLPSRAIVKMCILPSRDEMKAMCRPFGENVGLSLVPTPSVSVRVWPVATSKILMS